MSLQTSELTIELGNSLNQIASDFLGSQGNWRDIADLNGLSIFDELPIGESLRIPSANDLRELATSRLSQLGGLTELGDLSAIAATTIGTNPFQLIDWLYG